MQRFPKETNSTSRCFLAKWKTHGTQRPATDERSSVGSGVHKILDLIFDVDLSFVANLNLTVYLALKLHIRFFSEYRKTGLAA